MLTVDDIKRLHEGWSQVHEEAYKMFIAFLWLDEKPEDKRFDKWPLIEIQDGKLAWVALAKWEDGRCFFYEWLPEHEGMRKGVCRGYELRPLMCRQFPISYEGKSTHVGKFPTENCKGLEHDKVEDLTTEVIADLIDKSIEQMTEHHRVVKEWNDAELPPEKKTMWNFIRFVIGEELLDES